MKFFSSAITISFYFLTLLGCNQNVKEKKGSHSNWEKHSLPNGWVFYAPQNFIDSTLKGIDTHVGSIRSIPDSILLNYDIGDEIIKTNTICNFSKNVQDEQESIARGWYKDFYKIPFKHNAYIDTIDNMVAVIIKPSKTGDGQIALSISDCKSGSWLMIKGGNLTLEQEHLVLEIFRTVKLTKQLTN